VVRIGLGWLVVCSSLSCLHPTWSSRVFLILVAVVHCKSKNIIDTNRIKTLTLAFLVAANVFGIQSREGIKIESQKVYNAHNLHPERIIINSL
jgi:hypothetical protein